MLCWRCYSLITSRGVEGNLVFSIKDRSLLVQVCTVDASLLFSCSESLHQVPLSPVTHWVEYQLIFKRLIKHFGPKTTVFLFTVTMMKVKFLRALKATSRVYLTRTNTKNVKLTFLQRTVQLKKGGTEQHIMHLCLRHIHIHKIHSHQMYIIDHCTKGFPKAF